MNTNKVSGSLPTELIDEKSFFTLGGASAAVLLICWAISYVFEGVSWLDYTIFRVFGFFISEVFAVIIIMQKKNRSTIQWLFAFLNGLLIFVNASGLNVMTSSTIFNPEEKKVLYQFPKLPSEPIQQASIIQLPGMVNWWPDENLIDKNIRLLELNHNLVAENVRLKDIQKKTGSDNYQNFSGKNDSISLLKSQLADKQKHIEELSASIKNSGDKLRQQLTDCWTEKSGIEDSLKLVQQKFRLCEQTSVDLIEKYNKLQNAQNSFTDQINSFKKQLNDCINEKLALHENLGSCNNQLETLRRQLADCKNARPPDRENTEVKTRIDELLQRIKMLEAKKSIDEATLVELFKQIAIKNKMPVRVRSSAQLPDDNLLVNEDFYKTVNWPVFCRNFNAWYVKMSQN